MSTDKGRKLNVRHVGDGRYRFEYHDDQQYVRRTILLRDLTRFLTGQADLNANLGTGAAPLDLETFMNREYLPRCARPRFNNDRSYLAEVDLVRALIRTLGKVPVHEIRSRHSEEHKSVRLEAKMANNTVKRELRCLHRAIDYALTLGLVQENLLAPVRGLRSESRKEIWLNKEQFEKLLGCCSGEFKLLVEFLTLTGARIREALDFREGDIDWEKGVVRIPTLKRRKSPRLAMRKIEIDSMGPRLRLLLEKMVPHPQSRAYFSFQNDGAPMSYSWVSKLFREARVKAGLGHVKIHDLRGTFAMHRAVVIQDFRQLQAELGHSSPNAVQSYLDTAEQLDRSESIFAAEPPAAGQ